MIKHQNLLPFCHLYLAPTLQSYIFTPTKIPAYVQPWKCTSCISFQEGTRHSAARNAVSWKLWTSSPPSAFGLMLHITWGRPEPMTGHLCPMWDSFSGRSLFQGFPLDTPRLWQSWIIIYGLLYPILHLPPFIFQRY